MIHNGILIPDPPQYLGLSIEITGNTIRLGPKQEEMALAWAKKQGTPYVEDLVFLKNFLQDFSKALGLEAPLSIEQIDFSKVYRLVADEKAAKEGMTQEEKKALAAERKAQRDHLKEKFGYAVANGERIELANYMTEPSGIFMGRGKHPLRGRWKEGAVQKDVVLNLSPDAPVPPGEWKEVVWQPESMWVARWLDKLSDKQKYIWLHDTAPIKQAREAQKFDKASELSLVLDKVRQHIATGLQSESPKTRRIATACHLIDALCLRVGDEKDPDEADTVGATTLRPEHIKILDDNAVEFKFLGKDSVLWHKKIKLSAVVCRNLQELAEQARPSNSSKRHPAYDKPQLFYDVSSRSVNEFLSQVMPGLTAKVFRTHHATAAVRNNLNSSPVQLLDPEYKKWEAAVKANLEAAILCNHTKQPPKNWEQRKEKFKQREKNAQQRIEKLKKNLKNLDETLTHLRQDLRQKKQSASNAEKKKKLEAQYQKKLTAATKKIDMTKKQIDKAQEALGRLKVQRAIASENRAWNLGTSQKSYIDPRVFYRWGVKVDYDVLGKYYSTTLRRKFMWIANDNQEEQTHSEGNES